MTSNSCGQLVEAYTLVNNNKDYRRTHTYDALGRPDTTTQYLDTIYSSKNAYDEWSRLIRQQYQRGNATPKIFDHRYNRYGYLDRLERGNLVLWRATAQDASQHVSQAQLGNGLDVKYDYNPHTSRLKQSILQNSQGNALLQEGYTYDVLGNVDRRSQYWNNSGFSEGFTYDELNRLESATVDGQASQHFRYDAIGNILSKTGVGMGDYIYPAAGSNSVRPHAVKQIPGIGAHEYDDNGNLLSTIRSSRWVNIDWTSFDMPKRISKGEADISQFTYGPEHQRSKQTKTSQPNGNSAVTTTYYAGAQEADINNGQATVKTYWPYGLGVEIDQPGSNTSELNWSHHDRLGSIISISDSSGNLKEKLAYDSWGKRRTTDGSATPDNLDGQVDNKGYTGHEMLDQLDLVHMNGRIYDPLMARFLSADPFIAEPTESQSYNRYTYVWNNPTNLTDPTGFLPKISDSIANQICSQSVGCRVDKDGPNIVGGWSSSGEWISLNGRDNTGQRGSASNTTNLVRFYIDKGTSTTTAFESGLPTSVRTYEKIDVQPAHHYGSAEEILSQWIGFNPISYLARDMGASQRQADWIGFAATLIGNPKALGILAAQKTKILGANAITFTEKQLQKKFTAHAIDFGIERPWGKGAAEEFQSALSSHITNPETIAIPGTYRGVQDVTHFINPNTGLNVMTDSNGAFLSGWKLNSGQIENVLTRGSL